MKETRARSGPPWRPEPTPLEVAREPSLALLITGFGSLIGTTAASTETDPPRWLGYVQQTPAQSYVEYPTGHWDYVGEF